MTVPLHRGDLWWANVPGDTRRPVLVLTRERFIQRLSAVLVAPVTTAVRGIPTEVPLGDDDGMTQACAANFDNVFTLSTEHFVERISTLRPSRLGEVCDAYRFAAAC